MVSEVWIVGDNDQQGLGEISDVGHLVLDLDGSFTSMFTSVQPDCAFMVCAPF